MSEQTESAVLEEFENVFAGTGNHTQETTTCSTNDKCDASCFPGTTANTSAMHATM
jgi:hypothetical protein